MKSFRYLRNVATLDFQPSACTGCGRCMEVCPHQVFAVKGKKASIIDRDACMECGACARNCPTAAIRVEAGVGCASGIINEWMRERKLRASGGNCCS
ncbi:MAG: mercury methylation ferredoxin HgcB [Syntrophobacteraceae bacterium]|nr:mercury methylation ferredoxin HgcB [Syntrophobacteraceae bacterium]